MTRRSTVTEEALVRAAVARLRAGILAIVCGLASVDGASIDGQGRESSRSRVSDSRGLSTAAEAIASAITWM